VRFTDLGPFRAIRRDALARLALTDQNYGWTVEMQIRAAKLGVPTVEIPVRYRRRIGVSKVSGTMKGVIGAGAKILYVIGREAPDAPADRSNCDRAKMYSAFKHGRQVFPDQPLEIETSRNSELDHLIIRRDVEVSWHKQPVVPNPQDFLDATGESILFALRKLMSGKIGYLIDCKACAIGGGQIARVGSPLPSAIMRRRKRKGTRGVGRR